MRAARHDQVRPLFADRGPRGFDFFFHGTEVEARALLHWREFNRGHGQLLDLLLDKHETPEIVIERVEVLLGSVFGPAIGPAGALKRIETKVDQEGYVRLGLVAYPAAGLIDEAIFEVVDAHGAELAFAEIPDLVPIGRSLAGNHVHLVVAIQMALVGAVTDLLALLQLLDDVGVA